MFPVIRSFLFYCGYVPVTILLSTLFITLFPLLPDKQRYAICAFWCRVILVWLRISCGVRYQLKGTEHLTDEAVVILANHQSSWETILFYQLIYPIAPILKKELMNIPFWGWALRLMKPIAIDRSKPRQAGKSLLDQGVKRLGQGYSIILFPEGTRSPVGTIRPFSRGGAKLAIAASKPVLPVALDAGKCWPANRFRKYPGTITVEFGPLVFPEGHTADSLTSEVEGWIRTTIDGFSK